MLNYDKERFEEYLKTKVAESTAKTYATDMAVSIKALEKIKLYEGKDLVEILEDFVSHKKVVKDYLRDEFLNALVEIGSNDSGLYDSLLSKAKHYLAMVKAQEGNTSNEKEVDDADLSDEEKKWLEDLWYLDEAPEEIRSNKKFMMIAVQKSGRALEYASDELKNDKDIVLAAVQNNGSALEYASDELKNDKDIVKAAIENSLYSVNDIGETLKSDKDILLYAIKKANKENEKDIFSSSLESGNIKNFSPALFEDKEVISEICAVTPIPFIRSLVGRYGMDEEFLEPFQKNNDLLSAALKKDYEMRFDRAKEILDDESSTVADKTGLINDALVEHYNIYVLTALDEKFQITNPPEEECIVKKLSEQFTEEILNPLREQIASFDDVDTLVAYTYHDHDMLTLFNFKDYEDNIACEIGEKYLEYIDEADISSIAYAINRGGEDWEFSDNCRETYLQIIDKLEEMVQDGTITMSEIISIGNEGGSYFYMKDFSDDFKMEIRSYIEENADEIDYIEDIEEYLNEEEEEDDEW